MPAQIKITKRTVDRLEVGSADTFYRDADLPGFGLRINESGRKYYAVQFRADGRLRRTTLGRHWAVAPEAVRRRAMALIAEAKGCGDPAAVRDDSRKAATMKALGRRFLEEYVPAHCKPGTAYEYRRSAAGFIEPRIGSRKVAQIQRSEIAALHHDMRFTPHQQPDTRGAVQDVQSGGALGLAVGRLGLLPARQALSRGQTRAVPERVQPVRPGPRRDSGGWFRNRSAVAAIQLLMLTGCRLSEVRKLRWEHVDLDTGELRLPDSKTGGRAVPLAPSAARLLAVLSREPDNPWVIAGRKPGAHLTDLQHPWRRIRACGPRARWSTTTTPGDSASARAGLDDARIHDLRHSFASRALALGEGLPMTGKLLGHTQVQTTARSAHLARDTVKASAARIGDSIGRDLTEVE